MSPSDVSIEGQGTGRNAAADAESRAFHKGEIGLDTDATVKLNCDEVEETKCEATQKRVREDSRGDHQGHGLYETDVITV